MIFLSAADCELLSRPFPSPLILILITAVMIVRVYAMWNRSKWILYLLLFVYVPQVIIAIVLTAVYNTSTYLSGVSCINFAPHFSHQGCPSSPSALLCSHNHSIRGFLFMQCRMEECTLRAQGGSSNPTIYSRCYIVGPRGHSNIEAVDSHVQGKKSMAA